jgi:hypothetical protein
MSTCFAIALSVAMLAATQAVSSSAQTAQDWTAVEQALGRKGAMNPGSVMKFGFPRSDLQVTDAGVAIKPALALGSWVAFKRVGGRHTMVMGDLVLAEDEVGPVMRSLQEHDVSQTALHNHVLHESPRVMYMHIVAHGDEAKIAQAIHDALALSKTPLGSPAAAAGAGGIDLDTAAISRALGVAGKVNGGVYQVSVARRETIREGGNEVPPAMGVATAINFQPTGGGQAVATGDFVMRASEVNAVIRALQQAGIEVSALHSHMLTEEPRLFFMHFWGTDNAAKLAQGLRGALDKTAVKVAAKR